MQHALCLIEIFVLAYLIYCARSLHGELTESEADDLEELRRDLGIDEDEQVHGSNVVAAADQSPAHLANMNQPIEEHEDDGDSLGEGDLFEAPVAALSSNLLVDAALRARQDAESKAPASAPASAPSKGAAAERIQ